MYVGGFENPDDLMAFVKGITSNLTQLHFGESADELLVWASGAWATGSEFLEELANCCEHVLERDGARLPPCLREDIERCIGACDEAFP